jgi:hypothetical protein
MYGNRATELTEHTEGFGSVLSLRFSVSSVAPFFVGAPR